MYYPKKSRQKDATKQAVLAILRYHPSGLHAQSIWMSFKSSRETITKRLEELEKLGEVTRKLNEKEAILWVSCEAVILYALGSNPLGLQIKALRNRVRTGFKDGVDLLPKLRELLALGLVEIVTHTGASEASWTLHKNTLALKILRVLAKRPRTGFDFFELAEKSLIPNFLLSTFLTNLINRGYIKEACPRIKISRGYFGEDVRKQIPRWVISEKGKALLKRA